MQRALEQNKNELAIALEAEIKEKEHQLEAYGEFLQRTKDKIEDLHVEIRVPNETWTMGEMKLERIAWIWGRVEQITTWFVRWTDRNDYVHCENWTAPERGTRLRQLTIEGAFLLDAQPPEDE
jgi:regulator of sigma D